MKVSIRIRGMDCATRAVQLEDAIKKLKGVRRVNVHYALARAAVEYNGKRIGRSAIERTILDQGYQVRAPGDVWVKTNRSNVLEENIQPIELFIAFLLAIPLIAGMFWQPELGSVWGYAISDWIQLCAAWILVAWFGRHFHYRTLLGIREKRMDMNTLVTLGTGSALIWSTFALFDGGEVYFEVSGMMITFILLGKFLEHRQRSRANRTIEELLTLRTTLAHRVTADGTQEDVDPRVLRPGDTCIVKSGETVPMDGVIISGNATIDESMLTGEVIPIVKSKGDAVFGSTFNTEGNLIIRITAMAGKSTLDAIVQTVETALDTKTPIERYVDQLSGMFVPLVLMVAALSLFGWMLTTSDLAVSIRHAVAVLIVACPCAMGLATPAAILVGTGTGARKGILIKQGSALEIAQDVTHVIFDKTGTLTEGSLSVTDVIENRSSTVQPLSLLRIAGSLEQYSEHPFAQAILRYIREHTPKKLKLEEVDAFESAPGRGVRGKLKGTAIALGTESFITEQCVTIPDELRAQIDGLRKEAKTVILVSQNKTLIGIIAAQDRLKTESKKAVERLRSLHLEIELLTGDHLASANAVAKKLGIKTVYADISPNKKAEIIKSLQKDRKKVAFVGDGINDAPALAQADLGIAVGTGTDIAIATGQIVLMNGSPSNVAEAIQLSRTTFGAMKQNLFWAVIYNIVGIPLAATGYLSPIIASAAMALSSVSVLSNSLRIGRKLR
ncbi:heavy metal translocating P-type ATPase [Candidatus Uhrbacteria bacterium]|nr:heavy metal translocating P-type ATPase [Candidatus Uhrbacteria bacterium]MBD3284342.1 heavy metal translocating P-type ATPase [Candidatus Uhrbacteria bacterium]